MWGVCMFACAHAHTQKYPYVTLTCSLNHCLFYFVFGCLLNAIWSSNHGKLFLNMLVIGYGHVKA